MGDEPPATTTPVVPQASSLDEPLLLHGARRAKDDEEAQAQPRSCHAGASFSRTCLNLTNVVSGIGVLSMPYAVWQGGWLSLLLFAAVGAVCCYTGTLIERCMRADGSISSYPGIGRLAFGAVGQRAIAFVIYLELYLVAISFLVLEGDNLDKLFPGASLELLGYQLQGKKLFVFLAAAIILPTTWLKNLAVLAYVSVVGLVASVLLTASLVWAGLDTGTHSHSHRSNSVLNLGGLPTSLGLYLVCFAGHSVFPTIYSSMKNKNHFSKVLLISCVLCSLNYGLTGVLGYLIYGDDVQSQVTLNLPTGKVYSKIAVATTLINPLAKFALLVAPITAAIEERLSPLQKGSAREVISTMVLVSTALAASMVPFFGSLMSFIGSFLNVMVTVLFPCLCYLKIYKIGGIRRSELTAIVVILLIGVSVAVMGTYTSLQQILASF